MAVRPNPFRAIAAMAVQSTTAALRHNRQKNKSPVDLARGDRLVLANPAAVIPTAVRVPAATRLRVKAVVIAAVAPTTSCVI